MGRVHLLSVTPAAYGNRQVQYIATAATLLFILAALATLIGGAATALWMRRQSASADRIARIVTGMVTIIVILSSGLFGVRSALQSPVAAASTPASTATVDTYSATATPTETITPTPKPTKTAPVSPTATPKPQSTATPTPVPEDNSRFTGNQANPQDIPPNSTIALSYSYKNTGTTTWTNAAVYALACDSALSSDSNAFPCPSGSEGIVGLAKNIKPGQTASFCVIVTVPSQPGIYDTSWDMIHNGSVFGQHDTSIAAQFMVDPAAPPPTPPPSCP